LENKLVVQLLFGQIILKKLKHLKKIIEKNDNF